MKGRNRKEMKRNNGKQYENNGEEMKTYCLPQLMHAGKCVCQLQLPLFSCLLLFPHRVSSVSLTPHFPPIASPHRHFPQIYGSHTPLPSVLAIQTLISRSLSISPSQSCLSLSLSLSLSPSISLRLRKIKLAAEVALMAISSSCAGISSPAPPTCLISREANLWQ